MLFGNLKLLTFKMHLAISYLQNDCTEIAKER